MPKHRRTTIHIVKDVQETLKTAENGLEDLVNGPRNRKLSGLRNLVVFGRAVTNVLQGLRSTEPEFDTWYEKYVKEMDSDPLLKYFYDLRSLILKKGILKLTKKAHVKKLFFPYDMSRFGPPPPFAKSFFIGDELGGTGWEVEFPDGSKMKYYVKLPSDIGSVTLHFPNAPTHHLGKEISDYSIGKLSLIYIEYLRKMVRDAKSKFRKDKP